MNNQELNNKLGGLDDYHSELMPEALKADQKVLPYYSFGWLFVNFDKLIWLGISPYTQDNDKEITPYVGFCPRLKWNHTRWQATQEQSDAIKKLCTELATDPSQLKATELFDFIQTCRQEPQHT